MAFTQHNINGLVYSTAPAITAKHAFTTRYGGVSTGIFSSLNLAVSCGDEPGNVLENYRILCGALDIDMGSIVLSHQVHRTDIRNVTMSDRHIFGVPVPYEADGLLTNLHGLTLFIFTADCTPILLHDPVAGCIGAVHAGWRGTVGDIAGKAVRQMCSDFGCLPENIHAAIGPCISLCCFETGPEVPEAVRGVLGLKAMKFITASGGKFHVDLKGINRQLMQNAGVPEENISVSDECTMCSHDKYWSHRITNGKRGTQASLITLD